MNDSGNPRRRWARHWKRRLALALALVFLPAFAVFHQAKAAEQCRQKFWHCHAGLIPAPEKNMACAELTVRLKQTLSCYWRYLTPNSGVFQGFAPSGTAPAQGNGNSMSNIQVSTTAELVAALAKAKAGDVIQLASGTYSDVNLTGLNFSEAVRITSADPANPAVFTDLKINRSDGLSFSHIHLEATAGSDNYIFLTAASKNISFDHMVISGQPGDAAYEQQPFLMRDSSGITITNSEFTHAFNALNMWRNSDVTITDNIFHDIRCDGIRGSIYSDITIARNFFTDFHPRGAIGTTGDHADAIQLWTDGLNGPTTNVTISDNLFVRGDGLQIQGIFLRDTVGGMPFTDVTITGNTIIGGMYNGIAVMGGENVTITDNNVTGLPDQPSWIRVTDVAGGTVADNIATSYMQTNVSGIKFSSNDKILSSNGNAEKALEAFLKSHPEIADGIRHRLGLSVETSDAGSGGTDQAEQVDQADQVEQIVAPARPEPAIPQLVLNGTSGADDLRAKVDHVNYLHGGDGNDQLRGIANATTHMAGGAGDDWYFVRDASDTIFEEAGAGTDRVYSTINYVLGDNVEELWLQNAGLTGVGNALDNRLVGSSGDETLWGLDGNDLMQGGAGNDTLWGGNGNDTLRGDDGDDRLYGEADNDLLFGGAGDDYLDGGAGDDILEGGTGFDRFFGGAGKDQFRFRDEDFTSTSNVKAILDFCSEEGDIINLSLMDANSKVDGNQAFCFIGTTAFDGTAGQLRYEVMGGTSHVMGDIDGDGKADFTLLLDNVAVLHASDFWL